MSKDGTLQEWIVVPDEWVVEAPRELSPVEAASLVTAGTTAWSAIRGGLDLRYVVEWLLRIPGLTVRWL
jgi:NADPH:quinone reductase-like Zn-dependent oxidoreductase